MYEPSNRMLVDLHNFLVRAAVTERRLPSAINHNLKTYWPEITGERNVYFRPEKARVTVCHATNRQIDDHAKAMEMVITGLGNKEDRRLVWAVAHSAAFRERGPKFKKLAHKFKGMGGSYPKGWRGLKKRYEEALLSILYAHQYTRASKLPKEVG